MQLIKRLMIKGYKSIRDADLELRNLNVLIGGNGAGKSNLLSFFHMLNKIKENELKNYVQEQGGANALLYNGKKVTQECSFNIEYEDMGFSAKLKSGGADTLFFSKQEYEDMIDNTNNLYVSEGLPEWNEDHRMSSISIPTSIGHYHFQDTGVYSPMKSYCSINDNLFLAGDGRNIASVLYLLQKSFTDIYQKVLHAVQLIAPYFLDFILRENPLKPDTIRLEWRKTGCDIPFAADQLSDGTLRFICLATLLYLPDGLSRELILIDEPELGLHPLAITIISDLMKKASADKQLIIATQSVEFVNTFLPEDVVVVNHQEGETNFTRLDSVQLQEWLETYSLGELWEKNVLRGRP